LFVIYAPLASTGSRAQHQGKRLPAATILSDAWDDPIFRPRN